jgi:uncharacterized protein YidB (DUF937 family)
MGLLDDLVGAIGNAGATNQNHSDVVGALTGLLGSAGGLSGLMQSFEQAGLGTLVQSWIGTGKNLPVSAEQITQALSGGQLGAIASKLSMQHQDVAGLIAQILPQMVDHLTPNGAIPQHSDMLGSLAGLAQSFLKG